MWRWTRCVVSCRCGHSFAGKTTKCTKWVEISLLWVEGISNRKRPNQEPCLQNGHELVYTCAALSYTTMVTDRLNDRSMIRKDSAGLTSRAGLTKDFCLLIILATPRRSQEEKNKTFLGLLVQNTKLSPFPLPDRLLFLLPASGWRWPWWAAACRGSSPEPLRSWWRRRRRQWASASAWVVPWHWRSTTLTRRTGWLDRREEW